MRAKQVALLSRRVHSLRSPTCQKRLVSTFKQRPRPQYSRATSSQDRHGGLVRHSGTSAVIKRNESGCACHAPPVSKLRTAYIALGSNMGDRFQEIEEACNEMDRRGIRVKRTSNLYETEPMYVKDQDRFLNGACEIETELPPLALLDELQAIERKMGRRKIQDKGPRNIDLDILLYGDEQVNHDRLVIPHLGIPEREFVLRPLADLIPSKPLDPTRPWRFVQDYLNELAPSEPLTSLTPLKPSSSPLTPLKADKKTHTMGILNLTPDSFSDGGVHYRNDPMQTVRDMINQGVSIIDVGGQSTAPGREQVSAEEEQARILSTIEGIRSLSDSSRTAISVDTYWASVAAAALSHGADLVNDVSAGTLDPNMLKTVAQSGKTICLMHMRGTPLTMSKLTDYPKGLIPTVAEELRARVQAAEEAGIRRWRIILDPGIGFAKDGSQNLQLLRHLDELRHWPGLRGLPWIVGASRKGFIGKVTGVSNPSDRIWGTAATVSAAVQGGADVVRVHDVHQMGKVAAMSDAIWRA